MISILDFNESLRLLVAGLAMITLIAGMYSLIRSFQQEQPLYYRLIILFTVISNTFFEQDLYAGFNVRGKEGMHSFLVQLPWQISIEILAFFILINLVLMSINRNYFKNHVSPFTIKESFDFLPDGILYYDAKGAVQLSNTKIEELCRTITGKPLINALDFIDDLANERVVEGIEIMENAEIPLYQISPEEIYSFLRYPVEKDVMQLVASNVSDEYHLIENNQANLERIDAMNQKLRDYRVHMGELIVKKEIMKAKQGLHDALGKAMIMTKNCIDEKKEESDVRKEWREVLFLVQNYQEVSNVSDVTGELLEAGRSIGVEIIVDGELPENPEIQRVVEVATTESLLNAGRHGQAKHLYIYIYKDGKEVTVRYENDGISPGEEVREGGGLSIIRNALAEVNGSMEVISFPKFQLILHMKVK